MNSKKPGPGTTLNNSSKSGLKRWGHFPDEGPQAQPTVNNVSKPSKRFKTPSKTNISHEFEDLAVNKPSSVKSSTESHNWYQEVAPRSIKEVAVADNRIQSVQLWLSQNVLKAKGNEDNKAKLLLVTGPSGCGKTATIRLLCKELKIGVKEWLNSASTLAKSHFDKDDYSENYTSAAMKFYEFLLEAAFKEIGSDCEKNIAIIKEMPNGFIKNPNEFFELLENISTKKTAMVIFIITTNNSNEDRKLFPEEVTQKYKIEMINFNPCTDMLMKKAMLRVQDVIRAHPKLYSMPSEEAFSAILSASNGDIRCAINQLYLAATLGCKQLPLEITMNSLTKAGTKRKRPTKCAKLPFQLKDQSLGLFHSIGRVFHPKIDPETNRIHHNLDQIVDEFSTMPQMFLAFLHENYPRYFGDVTDATNAIQCLSMAQCLVGRWSEFRDMHSVGLYIAIMGIMLQNQHPVKAWNTIKGPKKIVCATSVLRSAILRPIDPVDLCYYQLLSKKANFDRFAKDAVV